jgi:hypothetical protein
MVQTKVGRYWEQAKRWIVCKMWPFKTKADAKRKYPKCVPLAKATRMSDSQRASAVRRKRAASNVGPKPTNVKTFARKKAFAGGKMQKYMGRSIKGEYGGVNLSNPSYVKYYKGMLD